MSNRTCEDNFIPLLLPAPGTPGIARGSGPRESAYPIEHCMKPLLSPDYRPTEKESFMNPMQLEYFRQKLLAWKAELLKESNETLSHLQEESLSEPDIADRASLETDRALELRTRDRERKLISKIDAALTRIEDGSYGYCEENFIPLLLPAPDQGESPPDSANRAPHETAAFDRLSSD